MSDLISRETVIDMLEDINAETEGVGFYFDHWVEYIKRLPSAEPQIIRCKDCKWYEKEGKESSYGYCHAMKHCHYSKHWEINIYRTYNEDFFCADAERREEE